MMKYNLFYVSKSKTNGVISYICHLMHSLRVMGHEAELFRITGRGERTTRNFYNSASIEYRNINLADALSMIRNSIDNASARNLIAGSSWSNYKKDPSHIVALLETGCELVLHAPWEMCDELRTVLVSYSISPIVIRQALAEHEDFSDLDPIVIPHPYVREERFLDYAPERKSNSVSITRISPEKNPEIILDANLILPEQLKIDMYGNSNPFYLYYKLKKKYDLEFPKGRAQIQAIPNHKGIFLSGDAVKILKKYQFCVDMSSFSKHGDGGGTQYTFLEAFDAEVPLILHTDWLSYADDEIVEEKTAIGVESVGDLCNFLEDFDADNCIDLVENGLDVLCAHSPEVIIPQFEQFFEGLSYD